MRPSKPRGCWAQGRTLVQGLLGAGADINAADADGRTLLHITAMENKPEVAKVLLANGAQVNACENYGNTALTYARARGYHEMEALLLQHGAESEAAASHRPRFHNVDDFLSFLQGLLCHD